MQSIFELNAARRLDLGKRNCRRLRRQDLVPGVIYGGKHETQTISLPHKVLSKCLEHEAFYSHLLQLQLDDNKLQVILKDVHRHPIQARILHVDFQRVASDDIINIAVPLHIIDADSCPGIKAGGNLNHQLNEVTIKCRAQDLPEFINVSIGKLNLNQVVHLSDLSLPQGVSIPSLSLGPSHDLPVVSIQQPRGGTEEAAPSPESAEETASATENTENNK